MITVLVADDQALVRAGFRVLLETQPDLIVVAEATNGAEAVDLARSHRPDVVLMDVQMPVLDGLAATRRLLADPNPPPVLVKSPAAIPTRLLPGRFSCPRRPSKLTSAES